MNIESQNKLEAESIEARVNLVTSKKFQIICLLIALFCISMSLYESKVQMINANKLISSSVPDDTIIKKHSRIPDNSIANEKKVLTLSARSACLMDASNGRVLYGKEEEQEMPMASTTKIMTLLVTLEQANLDDIVTVSSNAARQPDVQLNIRTGEQYILRDLLYSLMLESHNDTAVAIAEHVGGSVEGFCNLMTEKAKEMGAEHTQFKTPNGLDADGHYTTARDLSLIASKAIQNKQFCEIIQTQTYQFDSVDRKRSHHVNNKNRFLYMMDGALGVKTGFTNKAGYCFVGAIRINDRTFVSTVLGSGWPPHKEYKWADTKKLMNYGLDNYQMMPLFHDVTQDALLELPNTVDVVNGTENQVKIRPAEDLRGETLLMSPQERVSMQLEMYKQVAAPIKAGTTVGGIAYLIDDRIYRIIPLIAASDVGEADYMFQLKTLMNIW